FRLKLKDAYATKLHGLPVLLRLARPTPPTAVAPLISPGDTGRLRSLADEVYMDPKIEEYIVNLIEATRNPAVVKLDIADLIRYGASPRATIFLALAGKAHALLSGRGYVTPQDIKSIAMDVLRHRVVVTYEAEAEEKTSEDLIRQILDAVEVP